MSQHWFIEKKQFPNKSIVLISFILALIVILLGAYTRLTDAGLSCPDWPQCFGHLSAPHTASQIEQAAKLFPSVVLNTQKAWTEMIHRYFAGTLGLFILFLAVSFFISRKNNPKATYIAYGLIILIAIQVILGMLTVTAKLKPIIVMLHLLTGLSLLSLLWFAYLSLPFQPTIVSPHPTSMWIGLGILLLFIQIGLGGWVSSHYAGLACIDFPYCNGSLLPAIKWRFLDSHLISIHMLHRIGALIVGTSLVGLSFSLIRYGFKLMGMTILLLTICQLSLGILNIMLLRPIWIALAHHAIAIGLLIVLIKALLTVKITKEIAYAPLA